METAKKPEIEEEETPKQRRAKQIYQRRYCKGASPYEKAGVFSQLFFTWLSPLMKIASQVPLTQEMQYNLKREDKSLEVASRMEKIWYQIYPAGQLSPGTKTSSVGFLLMIWRAFKGSMVLCIFGLLLTTAIEFFNAYQVYLAINLLGEIDHSKSLKENEDQLLKLGYIMAAFVFIRIFGAVLNNFITFKLSLTGINLTNGINIMLFRKMFRRSLERDSTFDMGEITNLSQVDSKKFTHLFETGSWIIQIPMRVTFGITGLIILMGSVAVYSFGIMLLVLALNIYFTKMFKVNNVNYMRVSDLKGKLVSEIFKNIRYIKMVGLESYFLAKIKRLRDFELFWINRQNLRYVGMNFISAYGPAIYIITMYTVTIIQTGGLNLSSAFVAAMVFSIFALSFRTLSTYIVIVMDGIVSAKRLSFFLLSEELDLKYIQRLSKADSVQTPSDQLGQTQGDDLAVSISNGNFYWVDQFTKEFYRREKLRVSDKALKTKEEEKEQKMWMQLASDPKLKAKLLEDSEATIGSLKLTLPKNIIVLDDINLDIPSGACVAVVGKVGSGKSSLLSALAGEMYAMEGSKIVLRGTSAYVSQKPWLTSNTIKDVILFGQEYEEHRFKDCINFSCLEQDLEILDQGVDTLLGDRGVNLSGGQKTRLAIARALYSNADVFLLDDPISALDIHVGKKVMEAGFLGYLKGKTRLIATHALAYLPYFDMILIMDEGRIVEKGSYDQILNSPRFQEIKKVIEENQQVKEEERRQEEESFKRSTMTLKHSTILIKNQSAVKPGKDEQVGGDQIAVAGEVEPEEKSGDTSKHQKAIDQIIASEDRMKGYVIKWSLLTKCLNYAGGWSFVIIAIVCKPEFTRPTDIRFC